MELKQEINPTHYRRIIDITPQPTYVIGLDAVCYSSKPSGDEMKLIKRRLADSAENATVTLAELIRAIKQGQSVCPAELNTPVPSHKASEWKAQQLFFIDIDNTATKDENGNDIRLADADYITIERAQQILQDNNIHAFFIYKSFSYKSNFEKFRICIRLNEATTDATEHKHIAETLIHLFKDAADKLCKNRDRVFYGSTADCSLYEDIKAVTDKQVILNLYELSCKKTIKQTTPSETIAFWNPQNTIKTIDSQTNNAWYHEFDYNIDKLLFSLNPTCPYKDWFDMSNAYKGAGGNKDTWMAWSAQSVMWNADTDPDMWERLNGTGKAALINFAKQTIEGSQYMDDMKKAQEQAKQQYLQTQPKTKKNKKPELEPFKIHTGDSYKPYVADFVWKPYIPKGEYTVLFGDSGLGKNILCCGIVANITTGAPLPGETERSPAKVLFISSEDDGDHISERIRACGGDMANVLIADREDVLGYELLGKHFYFLEDRINLVQPQLVIIDPWQGFLNGTVDMNRANQVRTVMAKIGALAKRTNCGVLLISHINKTQQNRNLNYAISGSGEIVNASRSAFTIIQDNNPNGDDDPDKRIMVHTKSNKTSLGKSIYFNTTEDRLTWEGFCTIDKRTLEYAAQHNLNMYEAENKQHSRSDDFSDVIRAIIQVRDAFTDPVLKVTYDDLATAYQPMGEAIWKNRTKIQRKQIIENLRFVLYKEHHLNIEFINTPFPKLYDKTSKGRGFSISRVTNLP